MNVMMNLPAYIVLTNVSSLSIPIISEIGATSNFAANLGNRDCKKR